MSTLHSESAAVAALYFDGRSARAHPVTLSLRGDVLQVDGGEVSRREPLSVVRLSEPMGRAARLISFADGAHVEVRDHGALAHLLAASGHRDAAAVRWAFDLRAVLAMLAGLLLLLWFMWQYGLPGAARAAAPHVPEAAMSMLSEQTLAWLDQSLTTASALAPERQQTLRDALKASAVVDGKAVRHTLLFRAGGRIGANAFALPDGTLVVTDELVALAGDDEEVLAVLMHELGHVQQRHGVRLLLQGSATALFMAWYLGDVSSLLAGAPAALVQAGYSRDMEREADDFAIAALHARGRSPAMLADMLEKLVKAHGRTGQEAATGPSAWLSSHPDTAERIARLRSAQFAAD